MQIVMGNHVVLRETLALDKLIQRGVSLGGVPGKKWVARYKQSECVINGCITGNP